MSVNLAVLRIVVRIPDYYDSYDKWEPGFSDDMKVYIYWGSNGTDA